MHNPSTEQKEKKKKEKVPKMAEKIPFIIAKKQKLCGENSFEFR
jgi:hypothetical protein